MKQVIKVLALLLLAFCSFVHPLFNLNESENEIQEYLNSLSFAPRRVSTSSLGPLPIDAFFLHNYFNLNPQDKFNDLQLNQLIHNTSETCLSDLLFILREVSKPSKNIWLVKLLDSFGKLEAGLMEGNIHWEGDYWQCLDVTAPSSNVSNPVRFNGQYCTATWSLANVTQIYTGVCVPNSCSSQDIEQESKKMENIFKTIPIMKKIFAHINLISFSCLRTLPVEAHTIVYISFLISLTTLIIFATTVDIVQNTRLKSDDQQVGVKDDNENLEEGESSDTQTIISKLSSSCKTKVKPLIKLLICFSLYSNLKKLFQFKPTNRKDLKCIHGIRVLSMIWIIIGHTYAFGFITVKRPLQVFDEIDNLPFYTIINGTFSVDTFFVLSGFLLAYLIFSQNPNNLGFFKFTYSFFHRYWRLIPVYAFIIWTTASILPHLSSGPYWDYGDQPYSFIANCRTSWWKNLFFYNNIFDFKLSCLPHTWYLCNDFQFFLFSSIILIIILKQSNIGLILTVLACVASCIATFVRCYQSDFVDFYNEFNSNFDLNQTNTTAYFERAFEYLNGIYIKPYYRISPYLIGFSTGYLLWRYENLENKDLAPLFKIVASIVSVILCLTALYSTYHAHLSKLELSLYISLSRSGWALGLSWLIFACLTENAVLINAILSCNIFVPLSRLTYCAYLLHPLLQSIFFESLKAGIDFSHRVWMPLASAAIVFTYLLSIIFYTFVELPFINLEKFLINLFQKRDRSRLKAKSTLVCV